jgi:putative FmdB family regulatory protein
MPMYDFKCINCGEVREAIAKRDDILVCHKCASDMHRAEVNLSNFQLKGSGWFKDGYSDKRNNKR